MRKKIRGLIILSYSPKLCHETNDPSVSNEVGYLLFPWHHGEDIIAYFAVKVTIKHHTLHILSYSQSLNPPLFFSLWQSARNLNATVAILEQKLDSVLAMVENIKSFKIEELVPWGRRSPRSDTGGNSGTISFYILSFILLTDCPVFSHHSFFLFLDVTLWRREFYYKNKTINSK